MSPNGTSNSTELKISVPVAALLTSQACVTYLIDNGNKLASPGYAYISAGTSQIITHKTMALETWTASGNKLCDLFIDYFI